MTDERANPLIVFPDPQIAFCARHLEPFRKDYPKGYGLLCVRLIEFILADKRFTDLIPKDPETGLGRLEYASETLVQVSPLCCFMGDTVMEILVAMCLGKLT